MDQPDLILTGDSPEIIDAGQFGLLFAWIGVIQAG